MKFEQIKIFWLLVKLGMKIKMMHPVKRKIYVAAYRLNVDLDTTMITEEKEAIHKFLDKVVDK